jgi:putative Holliday junction resolvase
MKTLAIDFGEARTGLAISDPTGTVARPLEVVDRAGTEPGLQRIADVAHAEGVQRIVVGMPYTLRGEVGHQAQVTKTFVTALEARLQTSVETYDERFTSRVARDHSPDTPEDAAAAAHLLTSYLTWDASRNA